MHTDRLSHHTMSLVRGSTCRMTNLTKLFKSDSLFAVACQVASSFGAKNENTKSLLEAGEIKKFEDVSRAKAKRRLESLIRISIPQPNKYFFLQIYHVWTFYLQTFCILLQQLQSDVLIRSRFGCQSNYFFSGRSRCYAQSWFIELFLFSGRDNFSLKSLFHLQTVT